jgi:uncharacterized membrane protein YhaH (DUF805 family)
MIRRNTLNFAIDLLTLMVMLCVALTGLLLRFVLPPGSRGGAGRTLWNWGRHDFGDLHFYLVLGLLALLVVHLALHWNWVCVTVRRWFARGDSVERPVGWIRQAWGVLTLIAIVSACAVFFVAAMNSVRLTAGGEREGVRSEGRGRGAFIEPGSGEGRGFRRGGPVREKGIEL